MRKYFMLAVCVALMACGGKRTAEGTAGECCAEGDSLVEAAGDDEVVFIGSYEQVNEDGGDVQLYIGAWGSELDVTVKSYSGERLHATGDLDPAKIRRSKRGGVVLKTTLRQYDNNYDVTFADDVTITLDQRPDSLYDLSVAFDGEPSQSAIQVLRQPSRMFLVLPDEHELANTLPFNINKEKATLAAMLIALQPYVFYYELSATVAHIKRGFDTTELDESEHVVFDERNRYFCYSHGDMNVCLEGKYCTMSDGRLLLVLDQHDPTYENGQRLRFFIIDTARQMVAERMRHLMLPEELLEHGDAIFQVERRTETLLAVYSDAEGETQVETLGFDGKRFK